MSAFDYVTPGQYLVLSKAPDEKGWTVRDNSTAEKCAKQGQDFAARNHEVLIMQVVATARPGPMQWKTHAEEILTR